jgi:hypothetical protein
VQDNLIAMHRMRGPSLSQACLQFHDLYMWYAGQIIGLCRERAWPCLVSEKPCTTVVTSSVICNALIFIGASVEEKCMNGEEHVPY